MCTCISVDTEMHEARTECKLEGFTLVTCSSSGLSMVATMAFLEFVKNDI